MSDETENHMKIIPVMDIMDGIVVQAKGGLRHRYQPLRSKLTTSQRPVRVALAINNVFECKEMYVADLDAIIGRGDNLKLLQDINRHTGVSLLVDSGVSNPIGADRLVHAGIDRIIVGTETIREIGDLSGIIGRPSISETIVSIDCMNNKICSRCGFIANSSIEDMAKFFEALGASQLILLDLSKVGSLSGVNLDLVDSVLRSVAIPVLVGGGVKSIEELWMLKRKGVAGVLVSTAIHNGSITRADVFRLST